MKIYSLEEILPIIKINSTESKQQENEDRLEKKYKYFEGNAKELIQEVSVRSVSARNECLRIKGFKCEVCNFDFQEKYGELGTAFIHVHHISFLSNVTEEVEVFPHIDLAPVCPNCHAMLHKKNEKGEYTSIEQLKEIVGKIKGK